MILLDTSVWIEYFRQKEDYTADVSMLLRSRLVLAFEPVFAELLYGVRNRREKEVVLAYWKSLPKAPFEEGMLLESAALANEHKYYSKGIGLMDAVIIRATHEGALKLWTLDQKIISKLGKESLYKL